MAFLGSTPMLEVATPFVSQPTVIESSLTDIKKSMVSGIGMAIGLAIGGFILLTVVGKKL